MDEDRSLLAHNTDIKNELLLNMNTFDRFIFFQFVSVILNLIYRRLTVLIPLLVIGDPLLGHYTEEKTVELLNPKINFPPNDYKFVLYRLQENLNGLASCLLFCQLPSTIDCFLQGI